MQNLEVRTFSVTKFSDSRALLKARLQSTVGAPEKAAPGGESQSEALSGRHYGAHRVRFTADAALSARNQFSAGEIDLAVSAVRALSKYVTYRRRSIGNLQNFFPY